MIKIYTDVARQRHNYSDERRRNLLYAIATDMAYIAQERNVQSWTMKIRNDFHVLTCQFYVKGKPDRKTEDVFIKQFLKHGIEKELITIDRVE